MDEVGEEDDGTVAVVTLEDLKEELQVRQALDLTECKRSPIAFMGRHVKIEDPQGKVIPLHLWDFQKDVIRTAEANRVLIVLKARRLGLSWIALAFALWLAIFEQGIRILILCKNERDAAELLDRVRRMRDRMLASDTSKHLFIGVGKETGIERDTVTLLDVGRSTIRCLVGTPGAARSETAGFVLCDEFAFQSRAQEIWRGLLPTIEGAIDEEALNGEMQRQLRKIVTSHADELEERALELYKALLPEFDSSGRVWIVSTGDGDDNEFASQWERAQSGESGIAPVFIPWHARPGRDEKWKQKQIDLLGDEDRFRVEYPEEPEDAFMSPDRKFVYVRSHVNAAEKLGRAFDEMPAQERQLLCSGGKRVGGVDWGDYSSHALIAYPLSRGGIYIAGEHQASQQEPGEFTSEYLQMVEKDGALPLDEVAYDAAGQQAMRTFRSTARKLPRYQRLRTHEVAFGAYKSESIGYIRTLLKRTAEGKETRIIAISPRCEVLLSQLRKLEHDPKDPDKIKKQDDHGPDALVATVKKLAQQHRVSLDAEERKEAT